MVKIPLKVVSLVYLFFAGFRDKIPKVTPRPWFPIALPSLAFCNAKLYQSDKRCLVQLADTIEKIFAC
eukprot:scaffold25258_cov184-Skeletonema_dohrnii-CCMP3373.AAC.10